MARTPETRAVPAYLWRQWVQRSERTPGAQPNRRYECPVSKGMLAAILLAACGAGPPKPQSARTHYLGSSPVVQRQPSLADSSAPSAEQALARPDASAPSSGDALADGCGAEMARIESFCMDRYEDYVTELDEHGNEAAHSPFEPIAEGVLVRARSAKGVTPQAYISQSQASEACTNAGKRLCTGDEFVLACRGSDPADWYPYGGKERQPGACNEGKGSAVPRLYGRDSSRWTYQDFNDPRLNQWQGGLAPTGAHERCVSPFGVYDLVGNLHEWGADPADDKGHGRFRGGFYGDAELNGPGCLYVTKAHELKYHDYSIGFRCCADAK